MNRDKARTERFMLLYSPVWIGVIAWAMFGASLHAWGDAEHLILGVGLALPPWVLASWPGRPHARRFVLLVTLYSFIQCWLGSWLFFDAFGMEYHFHVSPRFVWKGTPAFLYFVTVAYFCTYYTAMVMLWRVFRRRFPRAGVAGVLVRALLSYAVAFAETAFMANETLKSYFSYGDPRWVMIWGSLCYGTIFFVTLPSFARLDEERPTGETTFDLVRHCLACNMLILMCYELYGFLIRR